MRLVAVMPHTHTVSYVAGISKMAAASEVRRLLVDTLPHTLTKGGQDLTIRRPLVTKVREWNKGPPCPTTKQSLVCSPACLAKRYIHMGWRVVRGPTMRHLHYSTLPYSPAPRTTVQTPATQRASRPAKHGLIEY